MKKFIEYILQFGELNQQQIDIIISKTKEIELLKGEYFSEAGKIPQQIGFIVKGINRVYFYNKKGEEITRYFIDENNFVVDINSYNQNIPSNAYSQSIIDSTYIVLSRDAMNELSIAIPEWNNILSKMITKALTEKVAKISSMMAKDAATRYETFIENFPMLANRIPLSYIASYLDITQQSLSRIRKNIR